MIKFKTLKFSNAFSYGEDNFIDFCSSPLIQLVGKNGHGKSSIAAILEEVTYNKNSKGIKKSDILNRYSKAKFYTIELDFDKDFDAYNIYTKRGSTQSVKLTKNGIDISAHTSTNTYKLIEEILGYDHKAFAQILYQSNASSLEFLTAPDTARKKFLIELLNLSKYTTVSDIFKETAKESSEKIIGNKSAISSISNWLTRLTSKNLELMLAKELPVLPKEVHEELLTAKMNLTSLAKDTKEIIQNNQYKNILDGIVLSPFSEQPKGDGLLDSRATIEASIRLCNSTINTHKQKAGITKCPTCSGPIDNSTAVSIVQNARTELATLNSSLEVVLSKIEAYNRDNKKYAAAQAAQTEWEKYHTLYNPTLPTTIPDKAELENKVRDLTAIIDKNTRERTATIAYNTEVAEHNATVKVLLSQQKEMLSDLQRVKDTLAVNEKLFNLRQILVKTFSTTGLVAYKLECVVKDLEDVTNEYLVLLSDGRFQLSFKVSSSDKLNVVITDNGRDIEITALSSGELARVNIATLLAIRKLMQAISNSRTNLLILDETIEHLDVEGKERLIEILLEEDYLNTVLISHSFSHPLLEKVQITKENGISRIER